MGNKNYKNELEGIINDFENGVSDKAETIKEISNLMNSFGKDVVVDFLKSSAESIEKMEKI